MIRRPPISTLHFSSAASDVYKRQDKRFTNNTNRVKNRGDLDQIINEIFGIFNRKTIIQKLQKAGVAYGQLSTVEDLAKHPQTNFISVSTSEGKINLLSPGAIINGENLNFGKVPVLGEHTSQIKKEYKSE